MYGSDRFFVLHWLVVTWLVSRETTAVSAHVPCTPYKYNFKTILFSEFCTVLVYAKILYMTRLHVNKLLSIQKMSHKHSNKDLSHLRKLSPGMQVNTRYKLHKLHQGYILKLILWWSLYALFPKTYCVLECIL